MKCIESSYNPYEALAPEYYDPSLHPTCANFRKASQLLIKPWLYKFADDRPICEVGAGMSLTAELLRETNPWALTNLYLTDSVRAMLHHSSHFKAAGVHEFVAMASNLPFASGTFGLCVSSLGDPYNDVKLWAELARVMSSDAYAIYTAPSYEWASLYRGSAHEGEDGLAAAEFLLSDGTAIFAPSIIHRQSCQKALISSTQELEVVDFQTVTYSQLPTTNISPKLLVAKENDLPVVAGYLIRKRKLPWRKERQELATASGNKSSCPMAELSEARLATRSSSAQLRYVLGLKPARQRIDGLSMQ